MKPSAAMILPGLLLAAGCATLPPERPTEIREPYLEVARKLGVNPIYPPREDMRVGDVYLISRATSDPEQTQSIWLGNLSSVRAKAMAYLKAFRENRDYDAGWAEDSPKPGFAAAPTPTPTSPFASPALMGAAGGLGGSARPPAFGGSPASEDPEDLEDLEDLAEIAARAGLASGLSPGLSGLSGSGALSGMAGLYNPAAAYGLSSFPPAELNDLPIVSFPGFSASAASLAGFGASLPGGSLALNLDASEKVNITYEDLRAFGPPHGSVHLSAADYMPEFRERICPVLPEARSRLATSLLSRGMLAEAAASPASVCAQSRGLTCELHVVTTTYITKKIQFSHLDREAAGFGARVAPTGAIPVSAPTVNLNLDLRGLPLGLTPGGLAPNVPPSVLPPAPETGLSVAAGRSSAVVFSAEYKRPIAVAYMSIQPDLIEAFKACESPQEP